MGESHYRRPESAVSPKRGPPRAPPPPTSWGRIRELCEDVGVGWTALIHAFREQFDVTPKAYITAARLSRVRKGLLQAPPETPIADVANRWGLWHMGQFAADYKRLFGELPSDTRSRMVVG